jgi:hypothetical protein
MRQEEKEEYGENVIQELQDIYLRNEVWKFMKGCVTLKGTFNQELRYVGLRLGT